MLLCIVVGEDENIPLNHICISVAGRVCTFHHLTPVSIGFVSNHKYWHAHIVTYLSDLRNKWFSVLVGLCDVVHDAGELLK